MNEGKGFIGRSVREMGGSEINQNALYITDSIYITYYNYITCMYVYIYINRYLMKHF